MAKYSSAVFFILSLFLSIGIPSNLKMNTCPISYLLRVTWIDLWFKSCVLVICLVQIIITLVFTGLEAWFVSFEHFSKGGVHSLNDLYWCSCSQMFFKTEVFKKFAIFTGKHLCWSLLSTKLQTWATLKRDSNTGVFLWILRNF